MVAAVPRIEVPNCLQEQPLEEFAKAWSIVARLVQKEGKSLNKVGKCILGNKSHPQVFNKQDKLKNVM